MKRLGRWLAAAGIAMMVSSSGLIAAQATPKTITFEDRSPGTLVYSDYRGVTFPNIASILEVPTTTHSGTQALLNRADPEEEFNSYPLRIEFSSPQTSVRLYAGLVEDTGGQTVYVTFTVFNADGRLLGGSGRSIGPGPSAIDAPFSIATPEPSITRVELSYESRYTEVIDDLRFDPSGSTESRDSQPPAVTILSPASGARTARDFIELSGTVYEETKLKSLSLTITPESGTAAPLQHSGQEPTLTFGPTLYGPLSPGANVLTVTAEDFGGNTAEDSVAVTYEPLPEDLNLFARGLEITQAIQAEVLTRSATRFEEPAAFEPRDYRADPPLVEGRDTVVRLYGGVEGTDQPVSDVPAWLYGFRDGRILPGSPLRPVTYDPPTRRYSVQKVQMTPGSSINELRTNESLSWNFRLPPEWTNGTIILHAEVNSQADFDRLPECDGCNDEANDLADITVRFNETGVILIWPWRIVWQSGNQTLVANSGITSEFQSVSRLYPVAREDVEVFPIYVGSIYTSSSDCADILNDLAWADLLKEEYPDRGELSGPLKKEIAFGIVSSQVPGLSCAGRARRPDDGLGGGRIAIGITPPSGTNPYDHLTPAHEIGHDFGLVHASNNHGECGGGACDPNFPHPHGGIGTVGFDTRFMRAINPGLPESAHYHDLMSYGGSPVAASRWISLTNYRRLYNMLRIDGTNAAMTPRSAPQPAPLSPSTERRPGMLVAGSIRADGSVDLKPIIEARLPVDDGVSRSGSYSIVLLDDTGDILYLRPFQPVDPEHDTSTTRTFALVLPQIDGTRTVEVRHAGSVLASTIRSAREPSVRLLSPNGGEELPASGSHDIRWEASDADGQQVTFLLQYSADGGVSWLPVAVNLRGTSYRIDLSSLEGSARALLRIVGTDGFNTSSDSSDRTFKVATKAPFVAITSPGRRTVFDCGAPVLLEGTAIDPEDGAMGAGDVTWSSNRDGSIGTGLRLTLDGPSLGAHVITVEATDSTGQHSKDRVQIVVAKPSAPSRTKALRACGESGSSHSGEDKTSFPIALVAGAGAGALILFVGVALLRRRAATRE